MENLRKSSFWTYTKEQLTAELNSSPEGLSTKEAQKRLLQNGHNVLKPKHHDSAFRSLLLQFANPLVLILVFAAIVSSVVGEWTDAVIIIVIVLASTLLSFTQEYRASKAVEKLRSQVAIKSMVLRDGIPKEILSEEIVTGDVVQLSAGSLIPADGIVIEANDFFVNQAVLTGETFPVEKRTTVANEEAELSERKNMVFMGTSARSGTAHVMIVSTGKDTEFGKIAEKLTLRPPETEFERGIRQFGNMLTQIMTVLVLVVLVINIILKKPPIDSLLFAVALAVGITPELLPAIISISLSKGAQDMAKRGVIVRRLNSIENLGSMDTLCTDKTGTLTEGSVHLDGALDAAGGPSDEVMRCAYLNAVFQTGIANMLDEAIIAHPHLDTAGMDKLYEIPYDFIRKRLSVIVDSDPGTVIKPLIITKGALDNVLSICTTVKTGGVKTSLDAAHLKSFDELYTKWSADGYRVLGIAVKEVEKKDDYTVEGDESEMTFMGFLLFFDPPKVDVQETLKELARLGVQVKIITGDNHLVAKHVAEQVGLPTDKIVTSRDLKNLTDEALWNIAQKATIFSEVDPNQKERIILALRKTGHVVGYMGDGINDAPALHAADVGISVEKAVDVAKEAADFVLLKHDLKVLIAGIEEGRRTFANTLKYIFTTTSANFGNMLSMAGASLFLPFLPLLAKQILLNNFLSDFPATGIPVDNVDVELVDRPHRWDIRFIRNFMVIFGLVSSVFDYMTFGLLIFMVRATEQQFQTGWFVESLLTELVIALVVRTHKPFYRSRPGKLLMALTAVVVVITLSMPYLPFAGFLGFTPLPGWVMLMLIALTVAYVIAAELAKKYFYKRMSW
ncbi:MAG: magnesium-translocating P-type ATPase [Youngiibacter sp.]|nr:magnesium-translocating P-type ATPase [Youngiibacter sp.]